MSHEVRTIPQDMPLQAAARLLSEARISGAPVVDGQGRCVGVFSATDIVHWVKNGGEAHQGRSPVHISFLSEWEVVNVEVLPKDEVRGHMTPGPVTVQPTTPITELAGIMAGSHIHRVIVTDALGRPIGIVTSTDLLAALASPDGDVSRFQAAARSARERWTNPTAWAGRDTTPRSH
jgi:CBS domain-containing protein